MQRQHSTRSQPKKNRAVLSADRILNSTSPIATASAATLHDFFQTCITNWSALYSEGEKAAIIASLPPPYRQYQKDESGRLTCPLDGNFVPGDPVFRANVPRFQRDVKEGYWTATWRKNALKASEERARGRFDEYLREHAEDAFGDGSGNGNGGGDASVDDGSDRDDDVGVYTSDGDYRVKKSARNDRKGRSDRKARGKGRVERVEVEAALHETDE